MSSDYLMQQISDMTKALANVLFSSKKEEPNEVFDLEGNFSESHFFFHYLKQLLLRGEIREAETALFDAIEKDATPELLQTALDFYKEVEKMGDASLASMNYPREDILAGLANLNNYYQLGENNEK